MSTLFADMKTGDWVAFAAAAFALIGVVWSNIVAQKALKLTSRHRLADFRKEWIESLRKDVADLLSQDTIMLNTFTQLNDLKTATKGADDPSLAQRLLSESVEVIKQREKAKADRLSSYSSILLKLNDEEAENGELIESLNSVLVANNMAESSKARTVVIVKARALFKREWIRLNSELKT